MTTSEDVTKYVMWLLRVLLPCLVFVISFRPRFLESRLAFLTSLIWVPGPRYSRADLMRYRRAVQGSAAPEQLKTLSMRVDEAAVARAAEAPEKSNTASPQRPKGGRSKAVKPAEEEAPSDPLEAFAPAAKSRQAAKIAASPEALRPTSTKELVALKEDLVQAAREQKMYMESLVNFVAFSQRNQPAFLCKGPPPPPPPRLCGQASSSDARANREAQMVLRGALRLRSCGAQVSRALHEQFSCMALQIWKETYALMVEACMEASDLNGATDFLIKMEADGHEPSSQLLDKVMGLYLQIRKQTLCSKEGDEASAAQKANGAAPPAAAWSPMPLMGYQQLGPHGTAAGQMMPQHPMHGQLSGHHMMPAVDMLRTPAAQGAAQRAAQGLLGVTPSAAAEFPAFSVPEEFRTVKRHSDGGKTDQNGVSANAAVFVPKHADAVPVAPPRDSTTNQEQNHEMTEDADSTGWKIAGSTSRAGKIKAAHPWRTEQ